jgi:hypothetical protein
MALQQLSPDRSRSGSRSGSLGSSYYKRIRIGGVARIVTYCLTASSARQPKGLAFAIDDLLAMQAWADSRRIRMAVRLDHGIGDEEYEEVIAFHTDLDSSCFLLIWRSTEAVVAQPFVGRQLTSRSVSHVLASLVAKQDVETPETPAR